MQSIVEDIKSNEFKQIYLLYGEETYLRKQYRDKLKAALVDSDSHMNYHYYDGKDIHFPELIDLAETMPFFADRRVIMVENSGIFKSGNDEIADYLKNPSPSVLFIFVESEVDKRNKVYKVVKDKGRAVEFPVQEEQVLKKWIRSLVVKEQKSISEYALNIFLDKVGNDMQNIKRELEKLICYTLNQETISEADVETICTTRVQNRIFDMINAIAARKQKQALALYYDLLELKEPPMRILFLIARQFNLLMQVKSLGNKGYDNKYISEKVGLHSFIVGKYKEQAGKFTIEALKQAVEACVEADESVKQGKINDKLSVELLLVRYSA